MYTKGEAVVYPMHGAGIIEDFEEKNVDGINRNYYVLRLPLGNLKILLCESSINNIKLRKVMDSHDIAQVMQNAANLSYSPKPDNWNQRYKDNMDKIKTGELSETAAVLYELYHREKQKSLSGAEKKVLTTAKKIVLSEIMLSYNVDRIEAEDILESYVAKAVV
jgi:CarD family transcriptional regulator